MNRVCLTKDGKLVEMQSGGYIHPDPKIDNAEYAATCLNTLKQNALNAGYKEDEIEVKWIDEKEWQGIQAELDKPTLEQIAERKREVLIQGKIREQAIAELKKEGKL